MKTILEIAEEILFFRGSSSGDEDEKMHDLRYCTDLIADCVEQKIKERDEQWFTTMIELGHLTNTDLIDEVNEKLPEPKLK